MNVSRRSGFTLIELLVVIAIISVLAVFLVPKIIPALRQTDRTACAANLKSLFGHLTVYQTRYKSLPPRRSGPDFVMALVDSGIIERTKQDLRVLVCPSLSAEVNVGGEDFEARDSDYTGPDQENQRKPMRLQQQGASNTPVICDRVSSNPDPDGKNMPHDNEGINVLFLGGTAEFIETAEFPDGFVVIGPDSPKENLRSMVPDDQ